MLNDVVICKIVGVKDPKNFENSNRRNLGMLIDNAISEVFDRDKKVFIPEFGAIIYSEFNDEIDFNELLTFDDGKIIAEIQKQQSISENEAIDALNEYVTLVKDNLENKGSHFIGGIGYVNKGEDGTLTVATSISEPVFGDEEVTDSTDAEEVKIKEETQNMDDPKPDLENIPDKQADSNPETTIEQETDFKEEAINSEEKLIATHDQEIESDLESDVISEESETQDFDVNQEDSLEPDYSYQAEDEESYQVNEEENDSSQKRRNPILITVAAIILLALIAMSLYLFVFKADSQNDKSISGSTLPAGEVKANIETLQEKNKVITEENESIASAEKESNESPTKLTSKSVRPLDANEGGQKVYSLILGSFKVERNADNFHEKLVSKGIEASIFRRTNDFYFVGIESINGKLDAIELLAKFRDEEEATAWIIRNL